MKYLQKYHVRQQNPADNGAACVKSVLKYYGADASLEKLRELSRGRQNSTTLLGLLQAAKTMGLEGKGYKAEPAFLQKLDAPCILHVSRGNIDSGFVVCYGYDARKDSYWIGDPEKKRIRSVPAAQVLEIWVSRFLLSLRGTAELKLVTEDRKAKRAWFQALLRPGRQLLVTVSVLGVLMVLLGLTAVSLSQRLIDDWLPTAELPGLMLGIGTLVLLWLLRSSLGYMRNFFLLRHSRDLNARLHTQLQQHLLHQGGTPLPGAENTSFSARLSGLEYLQRRTASLLGNGLLNSLSTVLAVAALFFYNWGAGLIALAGLPVLAYITLQFHRRTAPKQRSMLETYAKMEQRYTDLLPPAAVVDMSSTQRGLHQINGLHQNSLFNQSRLNISFALYLEIVVALLAGSILLFSSVQVFYGYLSTGGLIAIVQLVFIALGGAMGLARAAQPLQEALLVGERLQEYNRPV